MVGRSRRRKDFSRDGHTTAKTILSRCCRLRATGITHEPSNFLRLLIINWAWVTWSNGFSPSTELEQAKVLTQYISLCHQNHIRRGRLYFRSAICSGKTCSSTCLPVSPGSNSTLRRRRFFTAAPTAIWLTSRIQAWIDLEKTGRSRSESAGADALWIDNTFAYYRAEDVAHLIDVLYE